MRFDRFLNLMDVSNFIFIFILNKNKNVLRYNMLLLFEKLVIFRNVAKILTFFNTQTIIRNSGFFQSIIIFD